MIYESEEGLIKEGIPKRTKYAISIAFALFFIIVGFLFHSLFIGPLNFKVPMDDKFGGVVFEIKKGSSAVTIGKNLKDKGIISSAQIFNILTAFSGDTMRIKPGYYLFKSPTGALQAERRIVKGDFGLPSVKITFPEGFSLKQISERLDANLPFFDKENFLNLASTSEGYLFPETYFFLTNDNESIVLKKMLDMFAEKTKGILKGDALNTTDVIKMASVVEKEVRSLEDMKIVSGIFWKRLEIGMALQADSTLNYERNKTSAELTLKDLKQDSPYNSYTRNGLPPTPISNPGLNAISASINPTDSDYLYFLTDEDGKVYYAKTFEEHKRNKAKYL